MSLPMPSEAPRDINFGQLFSLDQVSRAMQEWLSNGNEGASADPKVDSFIKILTNQK